MLRLILLVAVFSWLHLACGEDNTCIGQTLIVSARDTTSKDKPFTLQLANLRAKVDDKPLQILAAAVPANPSRVVFALDASGSMLRKWQIVQGLVAEIISRSSGSAQFGVVVFADKVLKTVAFGKSGTEVVTEIASVKPYGRTALRDGIWEAVQMFDAGREGDSIVVVSDASDNHSRVSVARLQEAMWSRGIRIMFAQFVDRYLQTEENRFDDADAALLSESSGGLVVPIDKPLDAVNAAREIAFQIQNYISLRVTLAMPLEKQASLHLEAVDSSGRKRKDIELLYPQKLLPCASLHSAN